MGVGWTGGQETAHACAFRDRPVWAGEKTSQTQRRRSFRPQSMEYELREQLKGEGVGSIGVEVLRRCGLD